jgi:excisionase family DNA binding protein
MFPPTAASDKGSYVSYRPIAALLPGNGVSCQNNSNEITAPNWSGRLDLNQRPLAPQTDSESSAGLASGGTGAQALDIIGSIERADTLNAIDTTPDQRGFVPPVSPRYLELPERLLTVHEVAQRLRICSATVYKLCAAGELVHVRISNAIRVPPRDLAEFIARGRAGQQIGEAHPSRPDAPDELLGSLHDLG